MVHWIEVSSLDFAATAPQVTEYGASRSPDLQIRAGEVPDAAVCQGVVADREPQLDLVVAAVRIR
jgi:hypothetical protein